jgi:hypothetical protein
MSTPEPLPVELLATADERRPMGKHRLEYEAGRLQTATDAARPLPAGVVEELLADLRRLEAEKLEPHNLQ